MNLEESRLRGIWRSMKTRCLNPAVKNYKYYGGRGIIICNQWMNFEVFYNWAINNGYADNLTIERIDNDGIYSPKNCKWIPKCQQTLNKRWIKWITYKGETLPLTHLLKKLNISRSTYWHRLKKGWSTEDALTCLPNYGPRKTTNFNYHGKGIKNIEFNGESKPMAHWARQYGISAPAFHRRIKCGWPIEKALTVSTEGYFKKHIKVTSN